VARNPDREQHVERNALGIGMANIAVRHGIRLNTWATHRNAGFCTRRDSMTTADDFLTEIDLPD
jgi:hypothetical protein